MVDTMVELRPWVRGNIGVVGLVLALIFGGCNGGSGWDYRGWEVYGGDKSGSHYSSLDQINRSNVDQLEVAWTYHTGDMREDPPSTMECNPIIVDGVMYVTSARLRVIALDAATGEELWTFNPFQGDAPITVNRGVSYWEDGDDQRILFTANSQLFALDAETGTLIESFGEGGSVGLTYSIRTPGVVYNDRIILGSVGREGIRAYDVRTGEREWVFHTIPRPGQVGYETWPPDAWKTASKANDWSGMTVDPERGIVFASTACPRPQFYGRKRHGKNLFANSVIAIDAATGERIWHYQTIHHGLWDLDLPAPPNLVTIHHDGEMVDAVAQVTKTGQTFVLHRETGEPLFPVKEKQVPPSDLPGEEAWPTQPFPTKPEPFSRQGFTRDVIADRSPEVQQAVTERYNEVRGGEMFIPPSREGTIVYPGFHGGAEWGGASFDPSSGWLYVNANEIPWIVTMEEAKIGDTDAPASQGEALYTMNCSSCHGGDLQGDPPTYPSLEEVEGRLSRDEVRTILEEGRGIMPSFGHLSEDEIDAVVAYLLDGASEGKDAVDTAAAGPWFVHTGWHRFTGPDGYPAVKPPWGTLNAINLNTGEIEWKVPLGAYPELAAKGMDATGTENFGGSVVTEGGLVFIGASKDEMFRAFDKRTGEVLWETKLPAGGYATPSTYAVDGKQYVVIAAGGGKGSRAGEPHETDAGDAYVVFSLPAK